MNFSEYQELSKRTQPKGDCDGITNYALGLIGESAEVSELVKKWRYHGHELNPSKIAEELGDVMHYISGLCTMLGLTMNVVAMGNVEKLKERYPEGFSEQASREREVKLELKTMYHERG